MNENKFNGEGSIHGMSESDYWTKDQQPPVFIHYFSVRKKGKAGGLNRTNFVLMDTDKSGAIASTTLKERLRDSGDYDLRSLSYNMQAIYGGVKRHEPIDILSEYGLESRDDVTE